MKRPRGFKECIHGLDGKRIESYCREGMNRLLAHDLSVIQQRRSVVLLERDCLAQEIQPCTGTGKEVFGEPGERDHVFENGIRLLHVEPETGEVLQPQVAIAVDCSIFQPRLQIFFLACGARFRLK